MFKVLPLLARDRNSTSTSLSIKGNTLEAFGICHRRGSPQKLRGCGQISEPTAPETQMPLGHHCFSCLFPFACGCYPSLPLNNSFLFMVDDYLLSFIYLVEVTKTVSSQFQFQNSQGRTGQMPSLCQQLYPEGEVITYSHSGSRNDFDGGGKAFTGKGSWRGSSVPGC